MVVKFRNTILLPPPQLSLHWRAALSSNSNAERTQKVVYIVRCLWDQSKIYLDLLYNICVSAGHQVERLGEKLRDITKTFSSKAANDEKWLNFHRSLDPTTRRGVLLFLNAIKTKS
jgi:hypothetical protein